MLMREEDALRALKDMIRIPSVTGSPGEAEICAYMERLLRERGIETERVARTPERPNLLAAIRARRPTRPPLVLISHVDVVPANAEEWSHDPFGAEQDEGRVWGRGSLDTKQLTAMELYAFLRLKGREAELNRDVWFVATIDEEQGSDWGMGYVRRAKPELFRGAVVINEGGGFPLKINGGEYMMLTVGEKAVCRARVWAEGTGGHASAPTSDQAMLKLAEALRRVFEREGELDCGSRATQRDMRSIVGGDVWDNAVGADIFGYAGQNSISMRNYAIGVKSNVIPAAAEARLEFRLLPYAPQSAVEDFLARCLEDTEAHWEILGYEEGFESNRENSDLGSVADALAAACRRNGFGGKVLPMLALGRTDGRFFAGTGSVVYGCSPLLMGDSFDVVLPKVHGRDESILEESFRFGCRVLDETIAEICGAARREEGQEDAQ